MLDGTGVEVGVGVFVGVRVGVLVAIVVGVLVGVGVQARTLTLFVVLPVARLAPSLAVAAI